MNFLNFKMSRVSLWNKISCKLLCVVILFIVLCWPSRFAMFYYENLDSDEIYENLLKKTARNLSTRNVGLHCVSI